MTIVVAYADSPPGHAAVAAAVAESSRARETVIIVPAVRGDEVPDVGEVETRWPDIVGRVEVERGDLGDPSDTVVQVAQRRDARLVVLGLRARTPGREAGLRQHGPADPARRHVSGVGGQAAASLTCSQS
jgi:hypothetical protein